MHTQKKTLVELGGSWTPVTFDFGNLVIRGDWTEGEETFSAREFSAERERSGNIKINGHAIPKEIIGHFAEWLIGHYDNLG